MGNLNKLAGWIVDNKWRYLFVRCVMHTIACITVCATTATIFAVIYKAIQ